MLVKLPENKMKKKAHKGQKSQKELIDKFMLPRASLTILLRFVPNYRY